ncbi:membrane protein, suppressor for copper-sensitivity ScsB [Klebsiella pneumoniae]|uniref:Membrane protein, suppressor for copper-sensitivity ScsB n=1 Tax=Klebsiella pneumoniae TaxID=573 RepID=A0A3S4IP16_KLEPN|nr:membrane protein, suppressor for copper-sensitivity ScsB [Klebsiella pneumoniae]
MATLRLLLDRSAGKGLENLLALARGRRHRAGYRLAHAAGGELALADAAALRRRGHFHSRAIHGDVSFPMTLRGKIPPTLSGVLTLSTCSNVCILTDYPFSLDMTTPGGGAI